jgi:hypothetical protein
VVENEGRGYALTTRKACIKEQGLGLHTENLLWKAWGGCLLLAILISGPVLWPVTANGQQGDRGVLPEYGDLSPAQRYAGEILSCLLRIVVGESGDPKYWDEWKRRGVDLSLPDLDEVYAIMKDSKRNELTLMVLDPNLRFLTRVLYYYDKRLSLHKGADIVAVYPAPEFVALRLLILKKIQRGEKIHLGELMRRKEMLRMGAGEPSQGVLQTVGLHQEELTLIRQILDREPHLHAYLHSPFLVKALWEVGVLANDAFTVQKVQQAHYGDIAALCGEAFEENGQAVNVAVLPSLITTFEASDDPEAAPCTGFHPTEEYRELVQGLVEKILKAVERGEENTGRDQGASNGRTDLTRPQKALGERVRFFLEWSRPLLIYPENAEEVIHTVSPAADFTIVLLDKNLYLPLHIDEAGDVYPSVPWTYLDILDLKYDQAGDRIQEIAAFLRERLEKRAP